MTDIAKPSETLPADAVGMRVAVDTETSGLFVDDGATISIVSVAWIDHEHPDADERGVVSYAYPFDQGPRDKVAQTSLLEQDINLDEYEWSLLLSWLQDQWLVFQNAKFDLHHLRNGTRHWGGVELEDRTVWDTALASKELDPLENTSLKPTSERLGLTDGGEQAEKDAMDAALKGVAKQYRLGKRFDLVDWEVVGPYAAKDTELTILLDDMQRDRVTEGEVDPRWIDREHELMKVLYRIEKRGMGYDAERSMEAADALKALQLELESGMPFYPSINVAKRFFFGPKSEGGLGLLPYEVTEKKQEPKLDDAIVRRMVEDGHPYAEQYQLWRKYDYAQSMWYRGYPEAIGPDGRLRCSFRQTKVVSGRMSVERLNLQAIPHEPIHDSIPTVRELFVPRDGCRLWEVDWAQAELRVAAKLAKCQRMLDLIDAGEDLHGITTYELFADEGDLDDPLVWHFYRQIAKRANFSLIFDVGPDTFRAQLWAKAGVDLSRGQSERIVNDWKSLYPEFGRAVRRASRTVDHRQRKLGNGYVKLVNGRIRWFQEYEYSHKAFNQVVQPSLAELNKDWIIDVEDRFEDLDALIMNTHDSGLLELPDGEEDRLFKLLPEWGEWASEIFDVPMELEAKEW